MIMATIERTKEIWRTADCVSFDVDSTVVTDEGIDELARFLGCGEAVAALTVKAMGGGFSYREALRQRLNIIQPSLDNLNKFIAAHPPRLTPGVESLFSELSGRGVETFLISGGFRPIVQVVANQLGVPPTNVFANDLVFYSSSKNGNRIGEYCGFDEDQLTSEGDGKARVVASLKQERGYRRVVHVGDGMTDADACPPADAFIGFGGNVVREDVKLKASWFVMGFDELLNELRNTP